MDGPAFAGEVSDRFSLGIRVHAAAGSMTIRPPRALTTLAMVRNDGLPSRQAVK